MERSFGRMDTEVVTYQVVDFRKWGADADASYKQQSATMPGQCYWDCGVKTVAIQGQGYIEKVYISFLLPNLTSLIAGKWFWIWD